MYQGLVNEYTIDKFQVDWVIICQVLTLRLIYNWYDMDPIIKLYIQIFSSTYQGIKKARQTNRRFEYNRMKQNSVEGQAIYVENISKGSKKQNVKTVICRIEFYGFESYTLSTEDTKTLEDFEIWC